MPERRLPPSAGCEDQEPSERKAQTSGRMNCGGPSPPAADYGCRSVVVPAADDPEAIRRASS